MGMLTVLGAGGSQGGEGSCSLHSMRQWVGSWTVVSGWQCGTDGQAGNDLGVEEASTA